MADPGPTGSEPQDAKPDNGSSHSESSDDDPSKELLRLVEAGELDAVERYLDHNPALNLNNTDTFSEELPLHVAARFGHENLVDRLLVAGASPDVHCWWSRNALHCAASTKFLTPHIFESLKSHSKDPATYIDSLDKDDRTPLHLAAAEGDLKGVQTLINGGANLTLKDKFGYTPSTTSLQNTFDVMVEIVQRVPASTLSEEKEFEESSIWTAMQSVGGGEKVEWLLKRGAPASIMAVDGRTAYQYVLDVGIFPAAAGFAAAEWPTEPIPFSNDVDHGRWYNAFENNTARIHGLIWQIYRTSNMEERQMGDLLQQITSDFKLERDSDDPLGCREAKCDFRDLQYGPEFTSVVIPSFSSESLQNIKNGRQMKYQKATKEDIKYCLCPNASLLGIQFTSTLDEYCNPSLDKEILNRRNDDQVLVRYAKNKNQKQTKTPSLPVSERLLTVPQVWIWEIGNEIITSWPDGIGFIDSLVRYGRPFVDFLWYSDVSPDEVPFWGNSKQYQEHHALFTGAIISECVNVLNVPSKLGLSEPVFNMFEKSISEVSEGVSEYTRSSEVSNINMTKEKDFLHEIGDIREELAMIKSVIFEQEEVWREYTYKKLPHCWPAGPDDRFVVPITPSNGRDLYDAYKLLERPQTQFAKYKRQIDKLEADADRVEKSILIQLDLKSKHAGLKESHLTTIMSAAVIGFTLITIIFTPLSFLAALFALPIDRLQRIQIHSVTDDGSGSYTTNYIGKWMATIEIASLFVTVLAIWVAIEFTADFPVTGYFKKLIAPKQKGAKVLDQQSSPQEREASGVTEKDAQTPIPSTEQKQAWNIFHSWKKEHRQQDEEAGK